LFSDIVFIYCNHITPPVEALRFVVWYHLHHYFIQLSVAFNLSPRKSSYLLLTLVWVPANWWSYTQHCLY